MAKKNKPWFKSALSTASGVIVEWNPMALYVSSTPTVTPHYGELPSYNLRGFAVSGSTAIAVSTLVISLRYGKSSAGTLSTIALCKEPGAAMLGADNLMGIEGGYFALYTSVAHADGGLVGMIWGD